MRRTATVLILLSLALAVGILVVQDGSARADAPPTLATNMAAAKADAARLLTQVALPSGAQKLSGEPGDDNGFLHPLPHLSSNPGFVDTAWWHVSGGTPDRVIAAVEASPPSGVASIGTGGGGNARTGTSSVGLTFFLKDTSGVLQSRMVEITATALTGGGTGVMVQTQSQWVVPRRVATSIPGTTHVIIVDQTTHQGKVVRSATVTAASRVRATVNLFNGLESVQPGTTSCPSGPVGPSDLVTVKFLRKAGATPIATASFRGDFEQRGSGLSTECNPVELRVGAGGRVDLLGGRYVSSLNRLLGTRIP